MDDHTKSVVMVGGPNGAGKTTWAVRNLPRMLGINEFVNADEIARGLTPLNPESVAYDAGRLMLARLRELVEGGVSFAFETTCSGRAHAGFLERCRAEGYRVHLIYLWLPSADVAVSRVAKRVAQGGHGIPPDVIVRRYSLGLRNMRDLYLPLADTAHIYDNSDIGGLLIASRRDGAPLVVHDELRWNMILEATR
jgi:predicted ABC-type ATPase